MRRALRVNGLLRLQNKNIRQGRACGQEREE
jgi:hypothetical protein